MLSENIVDTEVQAKDVTHTAASNAAEADVMYAATIDAETAAERDNPLPPYVGFIQAVDRWVVDVPSGYACNAARFFVAGDPIFSLFGPGAYWPTWWRWHRRPRNKLLIHRDEQFYFPIRGFSGYGSMYWAVERRPSRNSKNYDLLALDPNPLFFYSSNTAEQVAQLCTPRPREETGRLFWMPLSE